NPHGGERGRSAGELPVPRQGAGILHALLHGVDGARPERQQPSLVVHDRDHQRAGEMRTVTAIHPAPSIPSPSPSRTAARQRAPGAWQRAPGARQRAPGPRRRRILGVTLIELVCTTAIVAILAMVAIPVVKTTIKKQKELELRRDLRLLRGAIDDYKRMVGDNAQLQTFMKTGSDGYPPDLDTLVTGMDT